MFAILPRCIIQSEFTSTISFSPFRIQGVAHVALVITDGESSNSSATIDAARRLRQTGVEILTMGIGNLQWLKKDELEGMASHPKMRNVYLVDDYSTLFTVTDVIISTVCDGKRS